MAHMTFFENNRSVGLNKPVGKLMKKCYG